MKAMFLTMALVFSTSSAFATVATLTATVQRVVTTAAGRTNVNTAILNRINAASALTISGANYTKLESLVKKIEDSTSVIAADNNDNMNGIPKEKRLEAVMLAYVSLVKNFTEGSGDANLERIVSGELFSRAIAPKVNQMDVSLYDKFLAFMKLYAEEGKSAEDASRDATGGSLREFANACGATVRR